MRPLLAATLLALLAGACSPHHPGTDAAVEDAFVRDAGTDVADAAPDVPPVDPCAPAPCGPVERCGTAPDGGVGEGNGADDNCDGRVDETCACVLDERESCFPGPPDRRGIGACHDGVAQCTELGVWGSCVGATLPSDEVCDGIDNNCDGRADEGLDGCATTLHCPANAGARPLTEYTVDGRTFDPDARAFHWDFQCPDGVSPCPAIAAPDDPTLRVNVLQSGTYVVHVRITRADGSEAECRFPLYVQGTGLRVELDWDTKGGLNSAGVDLDLHVAPIDPTRAQPAGWFSPDDCYYATCAAPGGVVDWATSPGDTRFAPSTDVSVCAGAPPPHGAAWSAAGRCWNPRLDTDDIECDPTVRDPTDPAYCFVENVNVDVAPEDVTFRLAVNFYRDHGTCDDASTGDDTTHPHLLVYCGGVLRGEIGDVDTGQVPVRCADNPGWGSDNWTWLAADVRFFTNACGLTDCAVRGLRSPASRFVACERAQETDDVCQDTAGRVFVRRAGARPVDADLPAALY